MMTKLNEIFVSLQIIFLDHLFFPAFFSVKENGRLIKERVSNKLNITDVLTKHRKNTPQTSDIKFLCHSI